MISRVLLTHLLFKMSLLSKRLFKDESVKFGVRNVRHCYCRVVITSRYVGVCNYLSSVGTLGSESVKWKNTETSPKILLRPSLFSSNVHLSPSFLTLVYVRRSLWSPPRPARFSVSREPTWLTWSKRTNKFVFTVLRQMKKESTMLTVGVSVPSLRYT